MALVSMFLCNQSYASHGRDFLLGATILNFNGSDLTHNAAPVGNQPLRLCRGELYAEESRLLDEGLESSGFMRSSGSLLGFVCAELSPLKLRSRFLSSRP